ncbi:hypothetical protein VB713_26830 [Anabaena cylindrica UHCC 0172]|uniref:hypothetical protein n=1 Tax=Anabaena cylindrica TaxID=1165 RepID=UPI002B1F9E27|nr:hypothetical protein [Anabaena cylindrica]MEA5554550.1 hypothetical protein [Anabaena cylindrica UHCC 0172]
MNTFFNYFWLLAILVNGLNAVIFWVRSQPYILKNPELQPGYIRLIRGFFLGMSIPWVVMGIGMTIGGVAQISDYFYPRNGNQFVIAWWVSIWALMILFSYWIWFRGGAEEFIKYPGLFKGNLKNPKTIKLMWLVSFISGIIAHAIIFSLEPN